MTSVDPADLKFITKNQPINWNHFREFFPLKDYGDYATKIMKTLKEKKFTNYDQLLDVCQQRPKVVADELDVELGDAANLRSYVSSLVPLYSTIKWDVLAYMFDVEEAQLKDFVASVCGIKRIRTYNDCLEVLIACKDNNAVQLVKLFEAKKVPSIVLAVSGNKWTKETLDHFNIKVQDLPYEEFFGGRQMKKLEELPENLRHFVENFSKMYRAIDEEKPKPLSELKAAEFLTEQIAKNVHLFTNSKNRLEVNVNQVGLYMLLLCEYDRIVNNLIITAQQTTKLRMSEEDKEAIADECLRKLSGLFFFLVQEDKTLDRETLGKIEAQLFAECIAAFQTNQEHVPSLDKYIFPCIILNGLCPYFYQVKVTAELSNLVKQGQQAIHTSMMKRYRLTDMSRSWTDTDHLLEIVSCYVDLKAILEPEASELNTAFAHTSQEETL